MNQTQNPTSAEINLLLAKNGLDNGVHLNSLLDRLRNWHKDAAALALDDDIRERVNGTLLNVDYAIEHLKAARSDKEQKLRSLG